MAKEKDGIVRRARVALGLTQKELGEKCWYVGENAQKIVSRWESGTRPIPRDKIILVANILNLELQELL